VFNKIFKIFKKIFFENFPTLMVGVPPVRGSGVKFFYFKRGGTPSPGVRVKFFYFKRGGTPSQGVRGKIFLL
jgi:hypothetical protein